MDSFLKEQSLKEQAVKTSWGQLALVIRSRRTLYVMGRWKGKMQRIYLQIKNCCRDLERNGFTEAGGWTANSLKNRHSGEFAALALLLSLQCWGGAWVQAWGGAAEGHRLQTHQSRYLAVEISDNDGRRGGEAGFAEGLLLAAGLGAAAAAARLLRRRLRGAARGCLGLRFRERHRPLLLRWRVQSTQRPALTFGEKNTTKQERRSLEFLQLRQDLWFTPSLYKLSNLKAFYAGLPLQPQQDSRISWNLASTPIFVMAWWGKYHR